MKALRHAFDLTAQPVTSHDVTAIHSHTVCVNTLHGLHMLL